MTIWTLSSSASSSSHSEALKKPRGSRRAGIALSAPKRRRLVQQRDPSRVADADDQNALADLLDMAEGDRLEPGNADVDIGGRLVAAGQLQVLALRGTRTHEHRIEAALGQKRPHALYGGVQLQVHPHPGNHGDLFVQHRVRQAERGDVGTHEPAGLPVLLENSDLIP